MNSKDKRFQAAEALIFLYDHFDGIGVMHSDFKKGMEVTKSLENYIYNSLPEN